MCTHMHAHTYVSPRPASEFYERPILLTSRHGGFLRLMDKILHDPKDRKLWELWYIPYNG